jgi:hypothetical protein
MAMTTTFYCSAEGIARALKGRRVGPDWIALCPAHDDRKPSLSIRQADDRVLVHCFAGCPQQAVIAELGRRGLWPVASVEPVSASAAPAAAAPQKKADDDAGERIRIAQRIWSETTPINGTLAESYLVDHRQLDVGGLDLRHALGWHAGIGALVGLMTKAASGEPCGVHRTFLDGTGTKTDRKMLGRQGVIRLSPDGDVTLGLGITEGVEDGLAVLLSGWSPVWAATSAGAIARFPVLAGIESLTVFADTDAPGVTAAEACCQRWQAEGREAHIAAPGRPA